MRACLPFLMLTVLGCLPRVGDLIDGGFESPTELDAGPAQDAGSVAPDAGRPPTCTDGLVNGTETDVDCGGPCAACATGLRCASPIDCESGVCSSGRCADPVQSCSAYAGCVSFVDLTAESASRVVSFPSGGQDRYAPKCLKIRFGQSVTLAGSFSEHPFEPACQPTSGPLTRVSSGSSTTFVFNTALGTYGYFCAQHGSMNGSGMAGAIWVVR